eukprot:444390-Pyramimonas_sp.AAC.1
MPDGGSGKTGALATGGGSIPDGGSARELRACTPGVFRVHTRVCSGCNPGCVPGVTGVFAGLTFGAAGGRGPGRRLRWPFASRNTLLATRFSQHASRNTLLAVCYSRLYRSRVTEGGGVRARDGGRPRGG